MSKHIWELAPKQAAELVESYLKNTNTTTRAEFIGSVDRIIGDYRDPVHATPELKPIDYDTSKYDLKPATPAADSNYPEIEGIKTQPEPTAESAEQQINNVLAKYDAESNGELGHVAGKYYLTAELLPILATAKAAGYDEGYAVQLRKDNDFIRMIQQEAKAEGRREETSRLYHLYDDEGMDAVIADLVEATAAERYKPKGDTPDET